MAGFCELGEGFGGVDDFDDFDDSDDFTTACSTLNEKLNVRSDEGRPVVPIKGMIYKVIGLNVIARLKHIRPLTPTAGILEMEQHGNKFYINPSDLGKATREEVESYLED